MVSMVTTTEKVEWTDPDKGLEGTQEAVEIKELVIGDRIGEG